MEIFSIQQLVSDGGAGWGAEGNPEQSGSSGMGSQLRDGQTAGCGFCLLNESLEVHQPQFGAKQSGARLRIKEHHVSVSVCSAQEFVTRTRTELDCCNS